jgi:hypothetical protein
MYIHPVSNTAVSPNKVTTISLAQGGGYSLGSNYIVTDTILNHNIAAPVITASKATTLCAGDSVILSTKDSIGGVPVTLLWSTGATTKTIKVKTSGTYSVKATNKQGFTGYSAPTQVTFTCGSPAGLTALVINKNSAVLSWGTVACATKYSLQLKTSTATSWTTYTVASLKDTIITLASNTTYQWQVASICNGGVTSSYTAGASFKTPASLESGAVSSTLGVKAETPDGFTASIYPNPATTTANLQVKGIKGQYAAMLISVQGNVLWQRQNNTDGTLSVPLSKLANGIYVVLVTDKTHTVRLKIVKQ